MIARAQHDEEPEARPAPAIVAAMMVLAQSLDDLARQTREVAEAIERHGL